MARLTVTEIVDIIAALEASKNYLCDGITYKSRKHTYICHAINEAFQNLEISVRQKFVAVDYISCMLGPHKCVFSWLTNNVPDFDDWFYKTDEAEVNKQLQTYRLRWINKMIVNMKRRLKRREAYYGL